MTRAGRLRAIARILLWASLLPFAVAGDPAAGPQPPTGLAVEEVLRQAARITWSDANAGAATGHRLQRRTRGSDGVWSDWMDVSAVPAPDGPDRVIDAGPDRKGLAPADYAYRVAAQGAAGAWSDWSSPAEFTLPPQCAGGDRPPGNEAPGALPTVVIGDLDGNGRHTGADVWIALQNCSKLGGCILEALPVVYDDVAISLYGQKDNRPCYLGNPLVCEPMPPFPNGLVIQGHGSATVFRSPVWKSPYRSAAILEFWHAPGVQLRFRNFVLDGRKREQPDPTPGVNDQAKWRHAGIRVDHAFGPDHSLRYPDGCVHNLTVRDFLFNGIVVNHLRNWRIEYNRVHDVGCWKGLTECPLLTIPDNSPPPGWGCNGYQVTGYGIYVADNSEDTQVIHNQVTRVTKYSIGVKGAGSGMEYMPRFLVRDNTITDAGTVGIFLSGPDDSLIERNLVDGSHAYGCRRGWGWGSWAIQTNGKLRNTQIRHNTLRNLASIAIGSNASVDGQLVFADNTIDNICLERNAKVGSVMAAIQLADGTSGRFTLLRNRVTNNHCSMSLAVGWKSNAQVVVDGGYYSTAENSDANEGAVSVGSNDSRLSPRVLLKGGAVFEYLGRQWRPGFIAKGNGRVVVLDESVRVKGYRDAFLEARSCMNGCTQQKAGTIVRCSARPSEPECH